MKTFRPGSAIGFRLVAALVLLGLGTGCGPPSDLVYSENPAVYQLGIAITPNRPYSDGGKVLNFSVAPTLPAGLSLDSSTGVITGTPTAITATASYLVTASNPLGKTTASLSITVDPVPTGSMGTARCAHTATMLPNGKVLIAGGGAGYTTLSSAELYDPATATFSPLAAWEITSFASAELYDPEAGTFSPAGSMGTARSLHTATLLQRKGAHRRGKFVRQRRTVPMMLSVRAPL